MGVMDSGRGGGGKRIGGIPRKNIPKKGIVVGDKRGFKLRLSIRQVRKHRDMVLGIRTHCQLGLESVFW